VDSTSQLKLPNDAIIIDLRISADEDAGLKVKQKIARLLEPNELQVFIEYITAEISYSLVTEESSPVLGAMRETFARIRDIVREDFAEIEDLVTALDEVIEAQNAEIEKLKKSSALLASENSSLRNSLSRLRKLLKADEVKEALSFCDKLRKQNVVGEIGQKAVLLGDSIKNALVAIKGV
jgi:regulator of replication initiation timing